MQASLRMALEPHSSTHETNAAVTFVIVHCRGYADLSACLESIEQCETPSDVLVIDHAFSAERLTPLAQRFAWARFIAEPGNPGFAAAVNRGFRNCTTPYVIVLNPDCVLSGPIRERLAVLSRRDARRRRGRSAAAGRGRTSATVGTPLSGPDDRVRRAPLVAHRDRARQLVLAPQSAADGRRHGAEAGGLGLRRLHDDSPRGVRAVGGMDERFFLYWEDADFCRRLAEAGWRTMWHPDAEVTHFGAGSSRFAPYRVAGRVPSQRVSLLSQACRTDRALRRAARGAAARRPAAVGVDLYTRARRPAAAADSLRAPRTSHVS